MTSWPTTKCLLSLGKYSGELGEEIDWRATTPRHDDSGTPHTLELLFQLQYLRIHYLTTTTIPGNSAADTLPDRLPSQKTCSMSIQKAERRHFVTHFVTILRLLNGRVSSRVSVGFLIFLSGFEEILIYHIGLLSAQFYYILLLKDVHQFYLQLAVTFALISFMSLVKSAKNYVSSVLYLEWREEVSRRLLDGYFSDLNFYFLNGSNLGEEPPLDNVDQRLSQDVDRLCAELSSVVSQIVLSPLTILYYSFQVSRTIGLFGLVACIAIFLASSAVNRCFIKSIVKWTYLKGQHEGDYRRDLANCVKASEMIALSNSEERQKSATLALLRRLLSVHENLILSQFFLNLSTSIFDYSGSVLSFIIIAVPIFSGSFDQLNKAELSHQISSNAFICMYLINCFSKILDISSNFGQVNGFGYRITELLSKLNNSDNGIHRASTMPFKEDYDTSLYLQLSNVSLTSPKEVFRNLNLKIKEKESMLIICESGAGKTALVRAIKGLWPIASGSIRCRFELTDNQQIMFIGHNSRLLQFYQQASLRLWPNSLPSSPSPSSSFSSSSS